MFPLNGTILLMGVRTRKTMRDAGVFEKNNLTCDIHLPNPIEQQEFWCQAPFQHAFEIGKKHVQHQICV